MLRPYGYPLSIACFRFPAGLVRDAMDRLLLELNIQGLLEKSRRVERAIRRKISTARSQLGKMLCEVYDGQSDHLPRLRMQSQNKIFADLNRFCFLWFAD